MTGECYADTLNVCHMVADGDCEPRLEMCVEEAQLHPELSDVRTLEDLVRNSGRLFQELKVMRHPFFIEMLEDVQELKVMRHPFFIEMLEDESCVRAPWS